MIKKLLSVLFLASVSLAQTSVLYCNLVVVDERCTCNFVIFNPQGLNNLTITANPTVNCTVNDVVDATGSGVTLNVPSILCTTFPSLETLKMNKLSIENLAGSPFRNCNNLKRLHLSGNAIAAIPAFTFSNTVLEILELDGNKITNVNSASFENLASLEILDLRSNAQLGLNNEMFDSLENLKILYMSSCGIVDKLDSRLFQNLKELRELDLSGNKIIILTASFNSLEKLESFNAANNAITNIAFTTFENNTELLKLNLENNLIDVFNKGHFKNLQKLTDLSLANNNRTNPTAELLAPLISMQRLSLSNCKINSINSTWFGMMTNLVELDLSINNIPNIPDDTFSGAGIESINFANNALTSLISRSFGSLENLRYLNVANNAINEIDFNFISQSIDLSVAYFGGNECADFNTDDFNSNRTSYIEALKVCFDNYDGNLIELTTTNSSIYNWYSIRSNDGWDALEVNVKSYENVHIALTDSTDTDIPSIEIQIGEDRDRGSNIFENGVLVFRDPTRKRLDKTAAVDFIIGWRFGIVMVFVKGVQFPFMAHAIQNKFDVNFFGLRTLFTDEPDLEAVWKVTRLLNTTPSMAMMKIYQDIETRMKSGLPIDLRKYLRN